VPDPLPARTTRAIIDRLEGQHPKADTELAYRTAFELLIATILSAQSTDARVNLVTPALFARFPDAPHLAEADQTEVERLIVSTGFFRQKARSIITTARALVERHDGEVPAEMDALTALSGVGRKTANVVLGHALGIPGFPVDRHVLRVATRLGIAVGDDPETVEAELCAKLPKERWTRASDTLILHGRRVCRPTPLCDRCAANDLCRYFAGLGATRTAPARARRPATRKGATKSTRPRR
jgi:endonuclease-3